ncbi:hypothetical protein, partial [Neisseria sp. P0022.S006]|uniref:hypothetical protein n=1 Tax=Neisseria sp. P0022.S006 TaxID=3436831 RepID=UPI003F80428D
VGGLCWVLGVVLCCGLLVVGGVGVLLLWVVCVGVFVCVVVFGGVWGGGVGLGFLLCLGVCGVVLGGVLLFCWLSFGLGVVVGVVVLLCGVLVVFGLFVLVCLVWGGCLVGCGLVWWLGHLVLVVLILVLGCLCEVVWLFVVVV